MAKAREPKPLHFWIINETRDTTLENLRYDQKSDSPLKLKPKMSPGDSQLCEIPREPGRPEAKPPKYDQKSDSPLKLKPKMSPGDSHLCKIPREPGRPEAKHLVVYVANSFTLAIFVDIDWKGSKRLQLELSHDMVHLGKQDDLEKTFSRMSEMQDPPDTKTTAVTRCELFDRGEVSTWLFAGPYKLMATLSYHTEHILTVQLEEREIH